MLNYGVDEFEKEIIIDHNNKQVMMEWEKPYMEDCIKKLAPFGDVLEIGFGLAYSANQIQRHPIKSHTIVDVNPEALKRCREWANEQPNPVNIISGSWQNNMHLLGKYDSVFLDDFPLTLNTKDSNFYLNVFLGQIIKNHSKKYTRVVWYSEAEYDDGFYNTLRSIAGNISFVVEEYKIEKPSNLKYGNPTIHKMYIPQLTIYN